jgi:addiction module HigA family antidote
MKNGMRAIHPGEILREDFMASLGMTAEQLAHELQVPVDTLDAVVHEKSPMTPELGRRINARFGGGNADTWMRLQAEYDANVAAPPDRPVPGG